MAAILMLFCSHENVHYAGLRRAPMKERGISFKEAVNSAVRAGLTPGKLERRHFVQMGRSLGSEQNFHWDKAMEVATDIGDDELALKLRLRK